MEATPRAGRTSNALARLRGHQEPGPRICAELDTVVTSLLSTAVRTDLCARRAHPAGARAASPRSALRGIAAYAGGVVAAVTPTASVRYWASVGTSEDGASWLSFLRSLVVRGLSGVELVTSDAHQGLRTAITTVFGGASWQPCGVSPHPRVGCRTHFMRNLLTRVDPKSAESGWWRRPCVRSSSSPRRRRCTPSMSGWWSNSMSASPWPRRCSPRRRRSSRSRPARSRTGSRSGRTTRGSACREIRRRTDGRHLPHRADGRPAGGRGARRAARRWAVARRY